MTRLRRRSTMWSMCSIDTGHASTHAPHVTQSQIDCSGTPLPTIGSVLCANTWSRMPMIRSFGERIFPVAYAGHASWQRPHSVHEKPSSTSFRVRSKIVAAPKRSSIVGHVEAQRLEPAARARAREPHVHRRRRDVQVLRVRQIREERADDDEMRPDEERAADVVPAEQRQHDERDHREDQVRLAEVRALEPRRPHDLADDERRDDSGEHEAGEDVAQHAVPLRRRHVAARGRDRREHDRREENEEAPEDERVHEPGHEPLQQLALAEHDLDLVSRPAAGRPRRDRSACAARTSRVRNHARRAKSPPQTIASTASAIAPMSRAPFAARR